MVRRIDPSIAGNKPFTSKPGVSTPANQMLIPLTTNRNNPNVNNVNGSVKTISIGLTIALTKPITTDASSAAPKFVTLKPGTILAVIIRETAVASHVNKKCGIFLPLFLFLFISIAYLGILIPIIV